MRARARRDGDDWVLDGRKMWITNGSDADVAVVWAQTDEGVRGFVVPTDTPGFSAPLIEHKLSLRRLARSSLEAALTYVRERTQFGRPISGSSARPARSSGPTGSPSSSQSSGT
jgi:alkylation response protein AidB-like acyl-CoA dehydrogenase